MLSTKSIKKSGTRVRGFSRGLMAEKILGATDCPGDLYFLIKVGITGSLSSFLCIILILQWEGSDEVDLVPAREANIKIPQVGSSYVQQIFCKIRFLVGRIWTFLLYCLIGLCISNFRWLSNFTKKRWSGLTSDKRRHFVKQNTILYVCLFLFTNA